MFMLRNGLSTPLPSQHDVITQVYDIFFELAPAGQEYFKQSATRAFVAVGMIGMTGWLAIQKPGGFKSTWHPKQVDLASKQVDLASKQVDLYI